MHYFANYILFLLGVFMHCISYCSCISLSNNDNTNIPVNVSNIKNKELILLSGEQPNHVTNNSDNYIPYNENEEIRVPSYLDDVFSYVLNSSTEPPLLEFDIDQQIQHEQETITNEGHVNDSKITQPNIIENFCVIPDKKKNIPVNLQVSNMPKTNKSREMNKDLFNKLKGYTELFSPVFANTTLELEKRRHRRNPNQISLSLKSTRIVEIFKIDCPSIVLDKSTIIHASIKFYPLQHRLMIHEVDTERIKLIEYLKKTSKFLSNNMSEFTFLLADNDQHSIVLVLKEIILNLVNSICMNIELSYYFNALEEILILWRTNYLFKTKANKNIRDNVLKHILQLLLKVIIYTNKECHLIRKFIYYDNTEREDSLLGIEEYINIVVSILTSVVDQLTTMELNDYENYEKIIYMLCKEESITQSSRCMVSFLSIKNIVKNSEFELVDGDKDKYERTSVKINVLNQIRVNKLKGIIAGILICFKTEINDVSFEKLTSILEIVY